MAGSSLGQLFRLTTAGESHGLGQLAIVEGCPAGLPLSIADIQPDLDRRRPGQSRYTTARQEQDAVQIISGVFNGKTTGTPIGLMILNQDQRSQDYSDIATVFRPAHGDFTYWHKYGGHHDYRGGGRASARETVMRVAAGAIAKKYLSLQGIQITGAVTQIAHITAAGWDVTPNPFNFADPSQIPALEALWRDLLKAGDSCGACVEIQATGLPVGLGEPVFDKLDAAIAHAMMGINAVKGVEIGDGFEVVTQRGSQHRDAITPNGFASNHAGGTLAGLSSGQPLRVRLAFKPTPSIRQRIATQTTTGHTVELSVTGRHDPCVGIRAVPIAEAMLALVLMDYWLRQRAHAPL